LTKEGGAGLTTLAKLWDSGDVSEWRRVLDAYWYVPTVQRNANLERRLGAAWQRRTEILGSRDEFTDFLRNGVYPWKGDHQSVPGWQRSLDKYNQDVPGGLDVIRKALPRVTGNESPAQSLKRLTPVGGMGIPVASACLALLYPERFGTVDRFTLRAFRTLDGNPVFDGFRRWVDDPDTYLNQQDNPQALHIAGLMILLYRDKARELTATDPADGWTPRQVEMVVWTVRDESV
jgi:hypothetical protein